MEPRKAKKLIVIVGPTAVGKTDIAIALAKHLKCEILSADSRQFYKEMSIGTAKPTQEEMEGIPHHFIDHLSIKDEYSAGKFEQESLATLQNLFQVHDTAILVGGSGLFVNAVCYGLDEIPSATAETRNKINEELAQKGITWLQEKIKIIDPLFYESVDLNNTRRLIRALEVYETSGKTLSYFQQKEKAERPFETIWIGLNLPREELYHRINKRVDLMINDGLMDEVKKLEKHQSLNPLKTVGYQEFYETKNKENSEDKNLSLAIELVKRNSRRYAKRQLTWFRKNEEIKWFSPYDLSPILNYVT